MARLTYHGPSELRANQLFEARLTVELEEEVVPGGKVVIAYRHMSDFGLAQNTDPKSENYITIETSRADVQWDLYSTEEYQAFRHPWNRGFELILKSGRVSPGDSIDVTLGSGAGYRCQSVALEKARFRVGVLPDESSRWIVEAVADSPSVTVLGNEPVGLDVFVPNMNGEEPHGSVCLKIRDSYHNPAALREPVDIDLVLDDNRPLQRVRASDGLLEVRDVGLPADGQWHTITAVTGDGRFASQSNPFGPSLVPGYRLYFGDLHSQSGLCDGEGSPAYQYEYGRKGAGLDFASVTSHDYEIMPVDWETIKEATKQAHRPGEYVTFLGYEWTGWTRNGGDHNIIYLGDDGPLIVCNPYESLPEWLEASGHLHVERTITETIEELGDVPALVIPHCGGDIVNLDFFDSTRMPALEIHSCHRNYEHMAQQAIERGLRCGFVGGSDDHRAALGNSHPLMRGGGMAAHNGLMGVYATELTRQSLWDATLARRVFCTNGPRIALSFSANDVFMGGELKLKAGDEVCFAFDVVADGFSGFDHAELVRDTTPIARFTGDGIRVPSFHGEFTEQAQPGDHAYYLRVYQLDSGRAWSSPVWVTGL